MKLQIFSPSLITILINLGIRSVSADLCLGNCETDGHGMKECTFTTMVDYHAGETGYFRFHECDAVNPTLGIEKGVTYRFNTEHQTNYYHPLGFAYYPDGHMSSELSADNSPPGSNSDCFESKSCPSAVYTIGDGGDHGEEHNGEGMGGDHGEEHDGYDMDGGYGEEHDGEHMGGGGSMRKTMMMDGGEMGGGDHGGEDMGGGHGHDDEGEDMGGGHGHDDEGEGHHDDHDEGEDHHDDHDEGEDHGSHGGHHEYHQKFVSDPVLWTKGGPYEVKLVFDVDDYTKDIFYHCHVHKYMSGRVKFVDHTGTPLHPHNMPSIDYTYDTPSSYDQTCGTYGLDAFQLPHPECPKKFVCNERDIEGPVGKFAECLDSMNCAMMVGMTTNIHHDSAVALFIHQMIPHHQNAVNMCKALKTSNEVNCEDITDQSDPDCVMARLCLEIINVQNMQIQEMRGVLHAKGYDQEDDCAIEIEGPMCTNAGEQYCIDGNEGRYEACVNTENGELEKKLMVLAAGTKCCQFGKQIVMQHADFECP